jgi:hypothetical protein
MPRPSYHSLHAWQGGCAPRGLGLSRVRARTRLRKAEAALDFPWARARSLQLDAARIRLERLELGP